MQIYFTFIFKDRYLNLPQQLWQERRNYQDCQAYDKHCNCLGCTPFPFLQKDTPNIGERYVQRHQDAPRECEQYRRGSKESLTQAKTKELAVPQHTGQSTKQDIVYIKGFLAIIAPTFVPGILIETIDGIRAQKQWLALNEWAEGEYTKYSSILGPLHMSQSPLCRVM